MTIYRAMPYLLLAVPPVVMLLTILIAGCTMSRTAPDPATARFYADPNSRAGDELIKELDRRAAREDMRRLIEEDQR